MLTFLFWNLCRNLRLADTLARLAERHRADVLILAENALTPADVLGALNRGGTFPAFHYAPGNPANANRIQIFTRFPPNFLRPEAASDETHWSIRALSHPLYESMLLVAAHLPDRRSQDAEAQDDFLQELGAAVRRAEERRGHRRTVVIGDLNVNPFAGGVISALGLHAVAARSVAEAGERIVYRRSYPFFYNPMWQFFNHPTAVAGTYYRTSNQARSLVWNLFDQVLVRPELLHLFNDDDVSILDGDGEAAFLTPNGLPDKRRFSDHLPLLFRLHNQE